MTEMVNTVSAEEEKLNPFKKALRTFCGWFGFGVFGALERYRRERV